MWRPAADAQRVAAERRDTRSTSSAHARTLTFAILGISHTSGNQTSTLSSANAAKAAVMYRDTSTISSVTVTSTAGQGRRRLHVSAVWP
jgi:hypothetical protein